MRHSLMMGLAAAAFALTGCDQIREVMGDSPGGAAGSAAGPVDLAADDPTPPQPQGPGTLRIVVSRPVAGEAPKEDRSADAYCASQQPAAASPSPAVVRIVDDMPATREVQGEPLVINASQCAFAPRIASVRDGRPLKIVNNDMTMHNVRAFRGKDKTSWFNVAQPPKAGAIEKVAQGGPIQLVCDIHPWESAYVFTTSHDWHALTNDEGEVTWSDVPAREEPYTIEVWLKGVGVQQLSVTVKAGQVTQVPVSFESQAVATP